MPETLFTISAKDGITMSDFRKRIMLAHGTEIKRNNTGQHIHVATGKPLNIRTNDFDNLVNTGFISVKA